MSRQSNVSWTLNFTCKTHKIRIRDDESCFLDADIESFEGEVISKSYIMKDEKNLGQFSTFEFSTISSSDDKVASILCEVEFDDPKGKTRSSYNNA